MNISVPKMKPTDDSKAPFGSADLMWQPYLTMSHALLFSQQNLFGFIAVNRELAEEMQAIFRRSRDLAIKISEKTLERAYPSRTMMSASELDELYDFAVSGMREVGDAALAAQLRSIETLRQHALNMLNTPNETASIPTKY